MTREPLSVQLYTLRDQVAADYAGTLRAVAELGYGAVELATLGSFSAAELRRELDTLGLRANGMHVPLVRLEGELPAVLDELTTLGAGYAICPWLPPERRSEQHYHELARTLSEAGRRCRDASIQLCYHNHDFELVEFAGRTGLDILFGESDPQLVQAELDVYWVARAGQDPVAWIERLDGRVPLVHLKDAAVGSGAFAEVGHGTLDIPAILAAGDRAGTRWWVVEQDQCARPPLESVGMSIAYLRSLDRA